MLAEILRARGYTTGAFTAGVFVDREFGFSAGFDSYSAVDLLQVEESVITHNRIAQVPGLSAALIRENDMGTLTRWIERHRQESFFLFFHTYAAHEFDAPERHRRALGLGQSLSADEDSQRLVYGGGLNPTELEVARLTDHYDAGVRFADEGVGALLG